MNHTPRFLIEKARVLLRDYRRTLVAIGGASAVGITLASCGTLQRTVIAPPSIPGATLVGNDNCAQCHDKVVKEFKSATHARLKSKGDNSKDVGCESCHGAGSIHSQAGGGRRNIVNPRRDSEACFQCHLEKRGQFGLASHHPVENGKVSCGDCHDPHKGDATVSGTGHLHGANDTCFKCHAAQRGPFIFEHEAAREGCTTCHNPHGSVNEKMLVSRNATLCLKCHFQQQAGPGVVRIGGQDHTAFLSRGTCWTAGCHEAVHGSQVGTSLRF